MKLAEREKAAAMFGGAEGAKSGGAGAKTFEPGMVAGAAGGGPEAMDEDAMPASGPTAAQLLALKAAIANAATLEEVQRLETALTTGIVPSNMTL